MFRSLLNRTSTAGVLGLIVGGTTAVTMVVAYVTARRCPNLHRSKYTEASAAVMAVFVLLYGLVFGLIIFGLSGTSDRASATVSTESANLSALTRGTEFYSPAAAISLRSAI